MARFCKGKLVVFWGVVRGVGVDINAEDRAEQLGAEQRMPGVGSAVDGGIDKVAVGIVVVAAYQEFELRVVLGVVDDFCELGEGSFVDDWPDEVAEALGRADFEGFGLGDELGFEGRPEGRGDVGAGCGAAFLALVFKGAADGVDDGVVDICALVDEVEVFAAGFADDAWVAFVLSFCDAGSDFAVQAAEDDGAAGIVEGSKIAMGEDDVGDLDGVAWEELNDIGGKAGFHEDLVDEVVGGDGGGGGFPNDDVAHQGGSGREVASDGGEVEGGDGVDETFQWSVFNSVPDTGRVMDWLQCV